MGKHITANIVKLPDALDAIPEKSVKTPAIPVVPRNKTPRNCKGSFTGLIRNRAITPQINKPQRNNNRI